jgi:hypothetical protein
VNFEVVEIVELSGEGATVYSVLLDDDERTLFELFIEEQISSYRSEVEDILARIQEMGKRHGAREQFFKLGEGPMGSHVCALYDIPGKALRLYCVRHGSGVLILGSGGPKTTRTYQEDPILLEHQQTMQLVDDSISRRLREKDVWFSRDYLKLEGDLTFYHDEE